MITMDKKKLLLHSCCGPCSTAVIERLIDTGEYDITVFYYNPNITDQAEYELRKKEQMRFLGEFSVERDLNLGFIEGDWDPSLFLDAVSGHEDDPEGGPRCSLCFRLRLEAAAKLAKQKGFDCFDTTLTVSPYKNYDVISQIGSSLASRYGIEYLCGNYKKKNGYNRSIELSRAYGLYRQHYCGCGFSKRDAMKDKTGRSSEASS